MMKEVSSSYNSPDVNKHDQAKTLVEGEVEEEPVVGSGVQEPDSLFKTYFVHLFTKKHTCLGEWHTSLSNVGQPNQTLLLASSQLAAATIWDGRF